MQKILLFLFFFWFSINDSFSNDLLVSRVTCERQINPLGVEREFPGLGWVLKSDVRNQSQSAYQILVASSMEKLNTNEGDLWNSGKVNSDQSQNLPYAGIKLESRQRCYWKVRVWDTNGNVSDYSRSAFWEMGLMNKSDWEAKWISAVTANVKPTPVLPAPYFRSNFLVDGEIKSVRMFVSGIGYYEAYLNGQKVSDHVLDPGVTRYDKRVLYVVYDITNEIKSSSLNTVGFILGNGWYNQHSKTAWDFDEAPWRDSPSLLAQLEIEYTNGSRKVIATDDRWKFSFGPITFNDVHNGETYDARLEFENWDNNTFDDASWKNAYEVTGPTGQLVSQQMPPIRIVQQLRPVKKTRVGDKWIFDFGQNMTGWARIKVKGNAGDSVTMQYGERLAQDGSLDMKELSRFIQTGEVQTDHYITKGGGSEEWHPRFTYHGYQYVSVETSSPDLEILELIADVLHTDFKSVGTFRCSDTTFNKIHENIRWSYRTNYHSYPTDCPHREKMGWTGDAQLVAEAGLFNFDATTSFLKWLDDFVDEQRSNGDLPGIIPSSGWGYTLGKDKNRELGYGPQWEGALITIVWQLYVTTGDKSILARYYPTIRKYFDFLTANATGYLIDFGIDDHKQLYPVTQGGILSAGFYFHFAGVVSKMAAALNNSADEKKYNMLAGNIQKAFNDKYFNVSSSQYGVGGQTQLSEALYFNIVDPASRDKVVDNLLKAIVLRNGHIETGVVGTKFLVNALMDNNQDRVLYEMASKTDFPGWGYWIKSGATTMFQNWDMSQSQNHIMFGTIGDYFYKGLTGIRVSEDGAGYKMFSIIPLLNNNIQHVQASHQTQYGDIRVEWKKIDGNLMLTVQVPVNTRADIIIPGIDSKNLKEGNRKLKKSRDILFKQELPDGLKITVGSGEYTFTSKLF